ncbi:hypothetical protein CYY_004308 [Polysphondylium violaceum]|uniref:Uncharacterized protein n=1 Tax=Polysphondylium violaceum TaxID=133409 RepID=A0A8J4PX80_9MYCE|nr:hypothetical protein CYY_004308 [Polysphondylium violaceum]
MEMQKKECFNELLGLELKWWTLLHADHIKEIQEKGYNIENLLFFAEILFVAENLKPMMMISELSSISLNQSFIKDVIVSSRLLQLYAHMDVVLVDEIETPNTIFNNCIIIYNTLSPHYPLLQQEILCKLPTSNTTTTASHKRVSTRLVIDDEKLSLLFNYPVQLVETDDAYMIDVGYSCNGKIVFSFIASQHQWTDNQSTIQQHFDLFSQKFKEIYEIQLQLLYTKFQVS